MRSVLEVELCDTLEPERYQAVRSSVSSCTCSAKNVALPGNLDQVTVVSNGARQAQLSLS
jgi:hypothetical protein